jgi:hypothetical protein
MVWEMDKEREEVFKAVLHLNGNEVVRGFDANNTIGEAVNKLCSENHLTSVVVKDCNDEEIGQDMGNKTFNEIGSIDLYPKVQGAF